MPVSSTAHSEEAIRHAQAWDVQIKHIHTEYGVRCIGHRGTRGVIDMAKV